MRFFSYSEGVQTPAEIEELRLRTPHPVKTPSDQHHVGLKPLADVTDFEEELFERARKKSGRNYAGT